MVLGAKFTLLLKLVKFWILEKESKYTHTYIVVNNWRKERLGRLAEPLSDKKIVEKVFQ